MKKIIEKLSTEVQVLEELLMAKRAELEATKTAAAQGTTALRDRAREQALEELFKLVFQVSAGLIKVTIVPEKDVTAIIRLQHNSARKIMDALRPISEGMVVVENRADLFGNPYIQISFPYNQLKSVEDGLQLSSGVNLSASESKITARC